MSGPRKASSGRPEKTIVGDGPVERFARAMRAERERANLTYRELAKRAKYSPSSLNAAVSGTTLPNWPLARAFLVACGCSESEWKKRWDRAVAESSNPTGLGASSAPAEPAERPEVRSPTG